ncbi:hypothetical protein D3C78_1688540 [compost metagenome]
MAKSGEFQPVERNVMRIEIDHVDTIRVGGEIGQHVAATGTDGDDAMSRLKLHRFHVDNWVFPDLRIDEAGKEQAEEALGEAGEREGLVLQERVFQLRIVSAKADVRGKFGHLCRSSS